MTKANFIQYLLAKKEIEFSYGRKIFFIAWDEQKGFILLDVLYDDTCVELTDFIQSIKEFLQQAQIDGKTLEYLLEYELEQIKIMGVY
ncbi:hypothetical protein MHB75_08825 [Kurthia sp. FSL E2-0154]|uniref:hypothetical protein n=1 Tax=Kurthia sp. FSL E2-0154 TaxID=2921358 RepID=UPI0030F8FFB7